MLGNGAEWSQLPDDLHVANCCNIAICTMHCSRTTGVARGVPNYH